MSRRPGSTSRNASRWILGALSAMLGVVGCGSAPEAPSVFAMPAAADRPVCGWQELEPKAAAFVVPKAGSVPKVPAGTRVMELSADDETDFARIKQALEPAAETLVRVKIVLNGRWLLPTTFPRRKPAEPPNPSDTVETQVGQHRVKRQRGVPIDRFVELRVSEQTLEVFLEGGAQQPHQSTVAELSRWLGQQRPLPEVFALVASDETSWQRLVAVLTAAACYDRSPGQEPHEVILRAEPARIWSE